MIIWRGSGIAVCMEAETAAVQAGATGGVRRVTSKDGEVLACDLLLVAAGIRAELGLAQQLGLAVEQGMMVDEQMRTSDPHVFAAGDVAQRDNKLYGLWPVAVSQAEVAAANAVAEPGAEPAAYVETPPVTMLKVAGIDLTSIGRVQARGRSRDQSRGGGCTPLS